MLTENGLQAIQKRLAAAVEPLPEEARMGAYYYGFERTYCGPVDAVLSAVAIAGKGSHNTDGWTDRDVYGYYDNRPGLPANPRIDDWTGGSAVDLIQLTAKASAEKVKSLSDDIAALLAEVERLKGQLEQLSVLPVVEAKGPDDTDASRFLIAARNLENGEYIGGSCTRRAVAALIRRDVTFALDGEAGR